MIDWIAQIMPSRCRDSDLFYHKIKKEAEVQPHFFVRICSIVFIF